jgi:hypothetical protein
MFEIYNLGALLFHFYVSNDIALCYIPTCTGGHTEIEDDKETMLVTMKTPQQGRTGSLSATPRGMRCRWPSTVFKKRKVFVAAHVNTQHHALNTVVIPLDRQREPRQRLRSFTLLSHCAAVQS